MIIEDIKYFKNTATITVEGELIANIELLTLEQSRLYIGSFIDEQNLQNLISQSNKILAKEYVFKLLATTARTKEELARKLRERKYNQDAIDYALQRASDYGYINDDAYVDSYITHPSKGKLRLKQELKMRGIQDDVLGDKLAVLDTQIEIPKIKALIEKYLRSHTLDKEQMPKLIRHLAMRGFEFETIRIALVEFNLDLEDINN